MAVRRLYATPGRICVLNNYQTNVYIHNNIHQNKNINNIIVIYIKASIYIDNIGFVYVYAEQWSRGLKMTQIMLFIIGWIYIKLCCLVSNTTMVFACRYT